MSYFAVSSEQMMSHRFKEEFFLCMPLNVLGGSGRFGRENVSNFMEVKPRICLSDNSKSSSLTFANGSVNSIKSIAYPF